MNWQRWKNRRVRLVLNGNLYLEGRIGTPPFYDDRFDQDSERYAFIHRLKEGVGYINLREVTEQEDCLRMTFHSGGRYMQRDEVVNDRLLREIGL